MEVRRGLTAKPKSSQHEGFKSAESKAEETIEFTTTSVAAASSYPTTVVKPLADNQQNTTSITEQTTDSAVVGYSSPVHYQQLIPASAPELEHKVPYLEPTANTFEEIGEAEWIHPADSTESFLQWAANDGNNDNDWIREPNANSDEELLLAINKRTRETGAGRSLKVGLNAVATGVISLGIAPYLNTRNIKPGEIHFSNNAGVQEIHVGSGYDYITSTQHSWGNIRRTNEKFIKEGIVTIVNILPGTIGIATDNNKPIILLPGRHAYNSQTFIMSETSTYDIKNDVISSNPISIIRVQPHELGLAYENGIPMLLKPGLHIKHNPGFLFSNKLNTRTLKLADENPGNPSRNCYEHGTISVVRIAKGDIGCAFEGATPVFLKHGIHIRNTQSFKFEKVVNTNEQYIKFNTLHLVRVNQGQLGYAMHNNVAIEMEAGLHEFDNPQFTFGKIVSINESLIQFGHITHIIVKAGEARAIWKEGKLEVLREGRYDFDSALLTVAPSSIPLQDIVKQLHQIKVSTNDRFQMFVSGQVTYRIENPEQLIKNIGQDKLAEYIEQRTDAILRNKISEKNLSMISPELHAELKDKAHAAGLQLFGSNKDKIEGGDDHRGMLCSEIMDKLTKDTANWGIKIAEFAISEIGFQDHALETALADASAKTRMAESALHLQQAQNVTETSKIKAVSAQKTIEQENAASILKIDTEAKNKALIANANATAEAEVAGRRIAADALFYTAEKEGQAAVIGLKIKADAALHVAKANSEAAKLRAEGEIAEANAKLVLLNNPNYLQLEMMRLQLQISQNLTNMPTPAVVFNGNGATSAANSMFLGNGVSMMEFAMKQKGNLFGRGRNQAPPEVVAQPQRSRSNSLS